MSHFWLTGDVTVDQLVQVTIRFCLPLVLTQMFRPRMDQKYFYKPICYLDIAIDPHLYAPSRRRTRAYCRIVLTNFDYSRIFDFSVPEPSLMSKSRISSLHRVTSGPPTLSELVWSVARGEFEICQWHFPRLIRGQAQSES